jgi:hypothetical protein
VGDVCRQVGISEQTFHRWKKVYGSMPPIEARELKQLRDEVSKLKRLVADTKRRFYGPLAIERQRKVSNKLNGRLKGIFGPRKIVEEGPGFLPRGLPRDDS